MEIKNIKLLERNNRRVFIFVWHMKDCFEQDTKITDKRFINFNALKLKSSRPQKTPLTN